MLGCAADGGRLRIIVRGYARMAQSRQARTLTVMTISISDRTRVDPTLGDIERRLVEARTTTAHHAR
jgi:hypothetical protein